MTESDELSKTEWLHWTWFLRWLLNDECIKMFETDDNEAFIEPPPGHDAKVTFKEAIEFLFDK